MPRPSKIQLAYEEIIEALDAYDGGVIRYHQLAVTLGVEVLRPLTALDLKWPRHWRDHFRFFAKALMEHGLNTHFELHEFVDRAPMRQVPGKFFVFEDDPVEKAFLKRLEGIQPYQLRCCSICDKLYYSRRHDSRECSKRCLRVRHTRKSRALHREGHDANID